MVLTAFLLTMLRYPLATTASSHLGTDCIWHALACQHLLAREGLDDARLVAGYAAWRVDGDDPGAVVCHHRDDSRRPALSRTDRTLVAQAIHCLEAVYLTKGDCLTSPKDTRDYLKLKLLGLPSEVFVCLFLDTRHRVIRYEELFRGTIDGASVHPREVVRRVIETNAAAGGTVGYLGGPRPLRDWRGGSHKAARRPG